MQNWFDRKRKVDKPVYRHEKWFCNLPSFANYPT